MQPTRFQRLLSAIFGLLFCLSVVAEPSNVLVGDLTFTRPPAWTWDPPTPGSPAKARFIIPNSGNRHIGDLRFYAAGREPETAEKIWKHYFPKPDADKLRRETKMVGNRTISYVFLEGTLTLPKDKPTAGQGFVGVVIPYGSNFVHLRLSGPKDLIEDSTPTLKRMVEEAVKEREAELSEK